MAKVIEYDISGVEESQGGTGVKVPVGVRIAKIAICEQRDKNAQGGPANDIRVGLNFGAAYDWGFTYIGLGEASDWKLAEFIRALSLKEKGKMDPAKQVGKFLRVKVNPDVYDDQPSVKMGKLFPAQPGDEAAWEEQGGGSASELSNRGTPDGPDEDDAAAESGAADGFEATREDADDDEVGVYEDWTDDDLLGEAEDRGLTMPGGRGSKRDKAIKALRADDEAAGDGDDDDAEAEASDDGDSDEYDDWDLDQLKNEWNDRQMGDLPPIKGRGAADRMKAAIIDELRKDDVENPFEG